MNPLGNVSRWAHIGLISLFALSCFGTEQLQRRPSARTPEAHAEQKKQFLRSQIEEHRRPDGSLPEDFCHLMGGCSVCTQVLLHTLQWSAQRTYVDYSVAITVDGKERSMSFFHYFLVFPGDDNTPEIIVDPTYKQFFTDPGVLEGKPHILIGTRDEVLNFFSRHRAWIFDIAYPPLKAGETVDGWEFAQYLYGFGLGAGSRRVHRP